LIILNNYSVLFVLFNVELRYGLLWSLYIASIIGIALIIAGSTSHHLNRQTAQIPLKSILFIGFVMLTFSIFGNVLVDLSYVLRILYLHIPNSLLTLFFTRATWLSEIVGLAGVVGWVTIVTRNRIRPIGYNNSRSLSIVFYALSIGAVITFIFLMVNATLKIILPILSSEILMSIYTPLQYAYAFVQPLGKVLLSAGWAIIVPTFFRKPKYIILMIYSTFLAICTILLLIPI